MIVTIVYKMSSHQTSLSSWNWVYHPGPASSPIWSLSIVLRWTPLHFPILPFWPQARPTTLHKSHQSLDNYEHHSTPKKEILKRWSVRVLYSALSRKALKESFGQHSFEYCLIVLTGCSRMLLRATNMMILKRVVILLVSSDNKAMISRLFLSVLSENLNQAINVGAEDC